MHSTEGRIPPGHEQLRKEVGGFADRVTSVVDELREMSRGIHPAVLSKGGLSPALEALALRSAVPVKLNVRHEQRPPDAVEVAAYYVASEALTNVAKHSDASRVEIDLDLDLDDARLRLSICDDGGGGADPSRGSGLVDLKDRVEALGGTIKIESPQGRGTRLQVAILVRSDSSAGRAGLRFQAARSSSASEPSSRSRRKAARSSARTCRGVKSSSTAVCSVVCSSPSAMP
jgi:signal transduction histidine kinase